MVYRRTWAHWHYPETSPPGKVQGQNPWVVCYRSIVKQSEYYEHYGRKPQCRGKEIFSVMGKKVTQRIFLALTAFKKLSEWLNRPKGRAKREVVNCGDLTAHAFNHSVKEIIKALHESRPYFKWHSVDGALKISTHEPSMKGYGTRGVSWNRSSRSDDGPPSG